MYKTLKVVGFECVINNLKGAGRRGFFGFRITLSFVFFSFIVSSVTSGYHRLPTRTGHVIEGDTSISLLNKQVILVLYILSLFFLHPFHIVMVVVS